jgi:uncharacterized membrane protein
MLIYRLGQTVAVLWLVIVSANLADGMVIHDVSAFLTAAVLPAVAIWIGGWVLAMVVGYALRGIGRLFHQ